MEYVLGYLIGSGADWTTIVITIAGCLVTAVILKAIFGDV